MNLGKIEVISQFGMKIKVYDKERATKDMATMNNLKIAIKNTFEHRKTKSDVLEMQDIITDISKDNIIKKLWKNYQNNSVYAKGIEFEELFDSLKFITSIL